MPYNYILDSKIREIVNMNLKNNIILFDEAHNLEKAAEEGVSFEISVQSLELCE